MIDGFGFMSKGGSAWWERTLLARGAFAPPDPVYSSMRLAYPAVFVAMAVDPLVL